MSRQFNRKYRLELIAPEGSTVIIEDLRISFEITKDLYGYPNLAKIRIYNLSPSSVNKISKEFTKIKITAGYEADIRQLFIGDTRNHSPS